jgi:hypothetical protein
VVGAQPKVVRQGLGESELYQFAGYLWIAGMVLIVGVAVVNITCKPVSTLVPDQITAHGTKLHITLKPASTLMAWLAALAGLLLIAGMALYRDGIRDLTLQMNGFKIQETDLWQRAVHPNWPVLILFLISFVAGLAAVGWLISVVMRAKPVPEKVNS